MDRMTLHPKDTPHAAYARAMRFGAYALAAVVARDYGLGRDLLIFALDQAICRFEKLGFPEAAEAFARQLGFTMVTVTPDELTRIVNGEGAPETVRPPSGHRFLN